MGAAEVLAEAVSQLNLSLSSSPPATSVVPRALPQKQPAVPSPSHSGLPEQQLALGSSPPTALPPCPL